MSTSLSRSTGVIRRERFERLDLDAIRSDHLLADVVAGVVPLRRAGGELKACCPFHQEKTPSFTIYDSGRRFQCFGCGAGGDVLDFVQRMHGVGLREAAGLLTCGDLPVVSLAAVPIDYECEDRTEEARAIWSAAVPAISTPAECYLRSRGLHLPIPDAIRFSRLHYGPNSPEHPVLVAAVHDVAGEIVGIQRTFLDASGTGKAIVPKPKLSLGRIGGGAIRLAPAEREVVVAEGLEDAASLQQQLGRSAWAACGTSNLPNMQFPSSVTAVVIGADNDPAGGEGAKKAAASFAERGLSVRVIRPLPGFKDFNDELRGIQ